MQVWRQGLEDVRLLGPESLVVTYGANGKRPQTSKLTNGARAARDQPWDPSWGDANRARVHVHSSEAGESLQLL